MGKHSPTTSGPEDLGVPDIRVPVFTPDGRRLHRFRQSSFKTIDTCMEAARLEMSGLMPDRETDTACIGTATHEGIETTLLEQIQCGKPLSLDDTITVSQDAFTEMMQDPAFVWVKVKEGGARRFITNATTAWYRDVLPTLQPLEVEIRFGPLVLYEDDERVIEIVGTIDYLDAMGPKDWKTNMGKPWERWEKERWDLQSTTYTFALNALGYPGSVGGYWDFEFVILAQKRTNDVVVERLNVRRHQGHFDWLKERALVVAKMIEAELPRWPLNDNHALCSPKFCPAWSQCKGKHFAEGWPKPDQPRTDLRPHNQCG